MKSRKVFPVLLVAAFVAAGCSDFHQPLAPEGDQNSASTDITISYTTRKAERNWFVDLAWSGASTTDVEILRDRDPIATTANDGSYSDKLTSVSVGSYTYQVCEPSTDTDTCTCSNEVTVSF